MDLLYFHICFTESPYVYQTCIMPFPMNLFSNVPLHVSVLPIGSLFGMRGLVLASAVALLGLKVMLM